MRRLYALAVVGVVGTLVLSAAIPTLDPRVPIPLVALYNLWLLATVTVVVAAGILLCVRFFSFITSGRGGPGR
ncbi:hypothetical protein HAPAU_02910 [Halalkalicoccus paucihalophilus]|jgi:hypothetical protein|uniref:Uncharacterized protein n=1 Tax=Halalkalicoccus paucihalophilus TaxID=1008153 RepID=A0A151AJ16_9EURY|nr:hypothetical protein [Halalkalicoccus paucihalophilus]KYH27623.1 hypothetical protein HAPAU_02910 [Halalkalicoccus paucihalophilus]